MRLPVSAQRLVAFLALHHVPMSRRRIAFTIWAGSTEQHAHGSLRSALWRLRRVAGEAEIVRTSGDTLQLAPAVQVDVAEAIALARRVLHEGDGGPAVQDVTQSSLSGELLPDWYDDWVLAERERLNELWVHSLEALSARSLSDGSFGPAIDAGLAAVRAEPLRESTHRALIRAYLAEGNNAQALVQYRRFARRLGDQAGLQPSWRMDELVDEMDAWQRGA